MSISALNIGLSGLQTFRRALDSSAHNVANSLTAGFKPQQVAFQEGATGGVAVVGNASADPGGTDFASETVQSIQYKTGFDLSAKVVKTADEILGVLIDIKA